MTAKFRVWVQPGKQPEWDSIPVVEVRQFGPDVWEVTVTGDGAEVERLVRSHKEVFSVYQRVT